MNKCKIISISNCKGGCGKSTSAVNIATAFAKNNKKVLLVDLDPQSNATLMMGINSSEINNTIATLMANVIDNAQFTEDVQEYIINKNGIDVLPSSIKLSTLESKLINAVCREFVLKTILDTVKDKYEYIVIDNLPSTGMLTINALTAADSVLIPTESHYLCYDGLETMLECINQIKYKLNPNLKIAGIIFTMYQSRTNLCKGIKELVETNYSDTFKIFNDPIPFSIKVAEQAVLGKSILDIDPKNTASINYTKIAEELMSDVD